MNPAATTRVAPVSGLQRGLWFMDRLNPGSTAYNVTWTLRFDGPVEVPLLRAAVDRVAERQEALRTTFVLAENGPCQVVHAPAGVPFARSDLPEADEAGVRRIVDRLADTVFDLERGPLIAVHAIRHGDATSLAVVVHHIVWDGWSQTVFERELAESYTALLTGRPARLPELTVTYADHARARLAEDDSEHLTHWREHLRGAPTTLELPADRPRPAQPSLRGRTERFTLPTGTAAAVRALAGAEDATPFTVMLTAFAALLQRHTGADDMVIGTPVTTRSSPEVADLVGYFVTILPLRVRIPAGASFRALLGLVRDTAFDAYGHADVPLDAIVDALGLDRSTRHAPLVQVLFGSHTEDPTPLLLGPARATRRVHANGTSKADLTWSVYDSGELRGEVEFSTDLLDVPTVRRMIARWQVLLGAALRHPDRPLWRLDLLEERERATATAGPREPARLVRCLHERFEHAVDRFPDRPAISYGTQTVSYAELDARANRLAAVLIRAGVRRGDRVGLLLERGPQVPIAVLAVLKAGAGYVPVDPATPPERTRFTFADTGVLVTLTDRGDAPAGPWQLLDLTDPGTVPAGLPADRPAVPVTPDDVAYVIFTSGSTGRPKGVAVAHGHVDRLMRSGRAHFDLDGHAVWTLFHSYAFDWTVWELWGALHHGGRLVLVPYLTSRSPAELVELLARDRVSHLSLTPSAFRQLEAALRQRPRPLPDLRRVMLGGEALDPAVVGRWFALRPTPTARVCNLYGITETTVHVTTYDIPDAAGFRRSLVGEPMPHLAALVLDDRGQPCPVGVTGELHVAGASLAHGYWGRGGLTARRFVPDALTGTPGARLYRSGDLARRLPDGGLEYVGRGDDQVKVRGFRIEPGEIEARLGEHPDVETCVVIVQGTAAEERRLVGYVTGGPPAPDLARLRSFLADSLPDHMIPAMLVLDALPLTANGKVDRDALPAPGLPAEPAGSRQEPRTLAERRLAQGFADVLGIDGVGLDDDFFHLGGDSIRAVQLTGRLRAGGWDLRLHDVFRSPVLADLAAGMTPASGAGPDPGDVPFDLVGPEDRAALPADVVDAYPMVSMQLSMIFHMELSGGAGSYHNVNSYRVSGRLDEQALRGAVAQAVSRHPVLRTGLDMVGHSVPLQLVHAMAPAPVEVQDLHERTPAECDAAVRRLFDRQCEARFDLAEPPLFRVTAQRLPGEAFQLTLAEHHAILDGWSFTSLLTEILEGHTALTADPRRPVADPPRSTFRQFVAAERAAAGSTASLRFWQERLAGVGGELWPAGDRSARVPEVPRAVERVLPDGARQLRSAATLAGVPVKAVALAAHVLALRAVTGRIAVTTGLSVNGRLEHADGTSAYGLFLNTVPLAAPAVEDPVRLARVLHAEEVAMLPHRRVPFARLARMMTGTVLDANFAFLRFHALGRLDTSATRLVDAVIGCEPTLRYEPTDFALGVALVQDPVSERVLLAVDHLRSLVPDALADDFAAAYTQALAALSSDHP